MHFGLALVVLGVAISGPYQYSVREQIVPGDTLDLGPYTVTYLDMKEGAMRNMAFVEIHLKVEKDGKELGVLKPQRRKYTSHEQLFAEAAVLDDHFYLGNEIYATLLGSSADKTVAVDVSVHPLVNWIWIGGTLMCVLPFVALGRLRRGKDFEA